MLIDETQSVASCWRLCNLTRSVYYRYFLGVNIINATEYDKEYILMDRIYPYGYYG